MRIASLLASSTEMLYALGVGPQVVAVSHECDFPAETRTKPTVTQARIDDLASSCSIDQQVKARIAAGEPLYEINVPRLAELAPDLIVTQAQCDVCAVRYDDVCAAVAQVPELRNTQILALNPNSLEDVFRDMEALAQAVNASERGARATTELRQRVAEVRRATDVLFAERPRVALIEWIAPLMLSGNWLPELVTMAGGRHDLTKPGAASPYVNWGELLAYDPEVVVVTPCGFDVDRTVRESTTLIDRYGWSDLTAVRSGRVYAVDGNAFFNRAGPRLVDSLELLGNLIWPDRVAPPTTMAEGVDYRRLV